MVNKCSNLPLYEEEINRVHQIGKEYKYKSSAKKS